MDFLTKLIPGQKATVKAIVTIGPYPNAEEFCGWFDFDQNGDWEPSELAIRYGPLKATGKAEEIVCEFTVPENARLGTTYARFTITYLTYNAPTRPDPPRGLTAGEVEDYKIVIGENGPYPPGAQDHYDFGDAPDSYKTYHNSGGPYHDVGQVMMGNSVNAETNGQPVPLADADNDDGVSFPLPLEVNQFATVVVNINSPLGVPAAITGWIDFDQSGTFEDPAERIASGIYTGAGVPISWTETFIVPSTALPGPTYARFRIYRTESGADFFPSHTGYGGEGEVEDYRVEIKPGPDTPPVGHLITGIKFYDLDGDGLWEPGDGESGLPNWTIWLDTNNDGTPDQTTQTNSQGYFEFAGVSPGTYTVGEESQPGWIQTSPPAPGTFTFTIPSGPLPTVHFMMFGNRQIDLPTGQLDFGDAEDPTYPTLLATNGARHLISPNLYLGSTVDAELDGLPSVSADGDDNNGSNDEDGVTLPPVITAGQSISISVTASAAGALNAWIDFNVDGDWADPGEYVIAARPVVAGTNVFTLNVPANAVTGQSFARFRLSSVRNLSYDGQAPDGEVEDYAVGIQEQGTGSITIIKDATPEDDTPFWISVVYGFMGGAAPYRDPSSNTSSVTNGPTGIYYMGESVPSGWILKDIVVTGDMDHGSVINVNNGTVDVDLDDGENITIVFKNEKVSFSGEYDFGDAPDPTYSTLLASNGARHVIDSTLYLGSTIDGEPDGLTSILADGDDQDSSNDEDGVILSPFIAPGQTVPITVVASGAGTVNAWLDFNINGDWGDAGEHIITAQPVIAGTNTFNITVPANAGLGLSFARFRLSSDRALSYTGEAPEGEVEDYAVEIKSPEDGSVTIIKETTPSDDTKFMFCIQQSSGFFNLLCTHLQDPSANQWVLLNPGNLQRVYESITPGWTLSDIQITGDTDNGSVINLSGYSVAVDFDPGENIVITFKNEKSDGGYDLGDAPSSYGSASHDLGSYRLGKVIDRETGPSFSAHADGDDVDQLDDEDGVTFYSDFVPGQQAAVGIEVTFSQQDFRVYVWIDFNQDGLFQAVTERIQWAPGGSVIVGGNTASVGGYVIVPPTAKIGKTFMRVRVRSFSTAPAPTGHGGMGEVEDYEIEIKADGTILPPGEILGGVKFNDLNGNGVWDVGEPALPGWTIWLDTNNDGTPDQTTQTDISGYFQFTGLAAGQYMVGEVQQTGWTQTAPAGDTYTVTVDPNAPSMSILFGNQQSGGPTYDGNICGSKWNDLNGDSIPDASEPYLANWTIYLDMNQNNRWDPGEPSQLTDVSGSFEFTGLAVGSYRVTEEIQPGWLQTWPGWPQLPGGHMVVIQPGIQSACVMFGNQQTGNGLPLDWGDAPDSRQWSGATWLGVPIGPSGSLDHLGIREVINSSTILDQVTCYSVLGSGTGTIVDYTMSMLNIHDSGDNGHFGSDDTFAVVGCVGGVPHGSVDDLCLIAQGVIRIPTGGAYTFCVTSDDGFTLQFPGHDFTSFSGGGEISPLTGGSAVRFSGDRSVADTLGVINLPAGDHLFVLTYHEHWGGATVELSAAQGARTGFDSSFRLVGDPNGLQLVTPSEYPTLQASNGAHHTIVPGFFLGGGIDGESEGQPTYDAKGDDIHGSDDEDGVIFITPLIPGQQAELEVAATALGMLDGWIDFDDDGSWSQTSDQIFISEPILAGGNILSFQVPASIATNIDTYARFRFSSAGALAPDGPAQDGEVEDYHILLGEEGPYLPDGGEGEVPHVKWSQPPIEIYPNVDVPPVFCGWSEPARTAEQPGQRRQWRMVVDDFRCLGPIPITRIRWWGGYRAWTLPEPPESQPEAWHIGLWANMVEGLEPDQLYLERLVWSVEIPNERVRHEPVGLEEFPESVHAMCFFYDLKLEPEEWFHQAEFESNENVFWISITAIYPVDTEAMNMWSWITRPHIWGNGAVMPAIMGEWPTYEERLFPGTLTPIENSLLCGQNQAYDLCFELLTEQPWAKWDQPFTGIREWPNYADDMSMALEPDEGELLISRQVADDWFSERPDPVTAIAWNGSYIGYGYEACKCEEVPEPHKPDYFLLSIWSNASGIDADCDNYPDEKIWEFVTHNYDEVLVGYDRNPQGEPNEAVFRYSVKLPEEAWFRQEAPENTYWLSVVAVFREPSDEIPYSWGWTNHSHTFGSPAMARDDSMSMILQWQPLPDSTACPVDMSFTLFTIPEQQSPTGQVYYSKSSNDGSTFEPGAIIDGTSAEPPPRINPAIAVDDQGIIHVVLEDYRANPALANIMYAKSRDGGRSFDEGVMVDDAVTVSTHQAKPQIAVDSDGIIHVVWEDYRRDSRLGDIYYAKSTDSGMTFGDDVCVDDLITITSRQINPVIAVDSRRIIHVAWEDYRNNAELGNIYYAKSTDGGQTFGTDTRVDDIFTDTTHQCNPAIAVDPLETVFIVWEDYRNAPHLGDIYCARSTDGGETFQENLMVDDPITITHRQIRPAVAVDDQGIVYVVWEDYRDNTELGNIYCSRSVDSGRIFENDVMVDALFTTSTHQANPAIATSGQGLVHIVWEDYRDYFEQANIYYSKSVDEGKTFGEDLIVNESAPATSSRLNPAIAADKLGVMHLVWQE